MSYFTKHSSLNLPVEEFFKIGEHLAKLWANADSIIRPIRLVFSPKDAELAR